MATYEDKPVSLLERKKRQWAQERDELEHLWVPWGNKHYFNSNSNIGRDQHNSKISIVNYSNSRKEAPSEDSKRKNSLPPLNKNLYNSSEKFEKGSETSGYASDNPNNTSEYLLPQPSWNNQAQNHSGYESSSSRDDRPKWKDKVMPSEQFWEGPKDCDDSYSGNEPPNWLKRGLEQKGHIEVTNSSPSESPEQGDTETDRPFTSSSTAGNRTHIRGQNIHLDTAELAEREQRRKIALQHQEEIRKQLEERERKRSEDRKRQIQEEYEEEMRIAREQEVEKRRREQEYKLLQEKQKKEDERKEAIKEAIEIAEKEAKLQKMKLKLMKQQNKDNCDNNNENEKNSSCEYNIRIKRNSANIKNNVERNNLTPKSVNTPHSKMNNTDNDDESLNNSVQSKIDMRNTSLCIKNNLDSPSCSHDISKNSLDSNNISAKNAHNQKFDPIALVIPSNPETLQHFQYAVLMPVPSSNSMPIAIPLTLASEKNHANVVNTTRTENRILTPTQYRQQNKMLCDSSTQTDDLKTEKYNREKNTNSEANYENRSRKGRSNSRNEIVSDRPKWGANRPPTRYMKQSEKDPLYQRKKLRQRNQANLYDDKNSSDESRTGTPQFRKKVYMGKRSIRPLWRKYDHDEIFSRNIRMYQSEIVPIRADKDQVWFEHKSCCGCRCKGEYNDGPKIDILKIEHKSCRNEEGIVGTSVDSSFIEDHNQMIDALPYVRIDMPKQKQCSTPRILSSNSNGNNF